ncbi:MAG: DUF6524 family protein [Cycloclasticus pugetii]|uniref:DUF6524 family protein n=1 Tax=Cycloclasticus TaxID=34067 RepID=UPI000286AB40|nr:MULTISPECIES: DUF6524 family protein [Cycloclasticus]AFT67953.1 hypothetical protein Q91_1919 [Cycloclasticus sp. P1]
MKTNQFSATNFFIRLAIATVLVFASYNPAGLSYYHWVVTKTPDITPLMALAGLILIIGWVIYIRATLRSLGAIGIALAIAFFGTIFWMIVDWGLVPADNIDAVTYIIQCILCFIMTTGMSWSHIRRRMSGQVDADDVDQ